MTKQVMYVPPFEVVKGMATFHSNEDTVVVGMTYDVFQEIIKKFLRAVEVDEGWYTQTYPDVAESIDGGSISSAKEHFVEHGYFEGRVPYELSVDDDWYVKNYVDVGAEISSGGVRSASEHFREYGYKEGRLPSAY